MGDLMTFPNTVEEFMEQYKITDTEQIYTNGADLVPIFRMKQWFEHCSERKKGVWERKWDSFFRIYVPCCSVCHKVAAVRTEVCPNCFAQMDTSDFVKEET